MSSIIKAPFVSFLEQKKEIKVVKSDDPKIINNTPTKEENEDEDKAIKEINDTKEEVASAIEIDEEYNNILNQAQLEAEEILKQAKEEAKKIETKSYEEGKAKGYEDGMNIGMQEIDSIKKDLEIERQNISIEKEKAIKEIEPVMIDLIKKIVTKLVDTQVVVDDTILYLIKQGFKEIELNGDIIIKVSSEDFDYVVENKDKITKNISEKVNLEILKETSLENKECVIETQMGNIDCSLGTQLNGLLKELKLISDGIKD